MDDYLTDRETLGKFVDELIKRSPVSDKTPEELEAWREKQMQIIDERISYAIFGRLNEAQLAELNQILDRGEESPEVFQKFFDDAHIDLVKIMEDTLQAYSAGFFGGRNE